MKNTSPASLVVEDPTLSSHRCGLEDGFRLLVLGLAVSLLCLPSVAVADTEDVTSSLDSAAASASEEADDGSAEKQEELAEGDEGTAEDEDDAAGNGDEPVEGDPPDTRLGEREGVGEEPAPLEAEEPGPQLVVQELDEPVDEGLEIVEPKDVDPAWRLYHEAFLHLADDDPVEAVAKLSRIRVDHRDHPAARLARETMHFMEAASAAPARTAPVGPGIEPRPERASFQIEQHSNLARAELASFQTTHGIIMGWQFALLLDVWSEEAVMALLMLGGGVGLGASLLATQHGIMPGHAQAINSGTRWGAWNAIALTLLLEPPFEAAVGMIMAGQIAGTAAGTGLWNKWRPHSGEVTVATSTGLWTGVFTAMLFGIVQPNIDFRFMLGTVLVMSDLGLVTGALASRHIQMSRGRANIINVSGGLGGLIGLGTSVILQMHDERLMLGASMLGAGAGLGLGYHFTQEWDSEDRHGFRLDGGRGSSVARLDLVPMQDGAALVLSRDL